MTTVIKLSGNDGGELRVSESVSDVTIELNGAQTRNERFVQFIDAESGKEIAVEHIRVKDVFEE